MMNADSIPSMCMNCQTNYYRDDAKNLPVVTMLFFCAPCRDGLSIKEWGLLEKFHRIVSLAWSDYNDCSRPFVQETHVHEIDFREARSAVLQSMYQSFKNNTTRDGIYQTLQSCKLFAVTKTNVLDMIELLEEYDAIIKEKQNGTQGKTTTN